ncbi:SufE family protein [Rosistilla oblonga]|uniref:SufE family protein n=1 Tax=Rosistilla oblonga TaxID=2527990 RepID=UPI003A983FCE
MQTITPDELREEFQEINDYDERLEYIIEFADGLPQMAAEHRIEPNRVQGCVSNVWLVASQRPTESAEDSPILDFEADSDAVITRGLIAIIVALLSGKPAKEILAIDIDGLFTELDLQGHLTRSRSNGLRSMVRRVRELAEAAL